MNILIDLMFLLPSRFIYGTLTKTKDTITQTNETINGHADM